MNKFEHKNSIKQKSHYFSYLIAILVGITFIYQLRLFLDDSQFMWISVSTYSIIPGIVVGISIILTIKLYKQKHFQSTAFLFFTIGAASRFVAEQIWQIYDHVYDINPFPSMADIFFIAAYPFFVAFLIISLKPILKTISKKVWLFAICLSVSFLIPSLLVSYDNLDTESFPNLIALSYPIMSSFQLAPAIVGVMFLVKRDAGNSWMLLLFGFLIFSISDTFFLLSELNGSYYDGHPVDLMFLFGFVFLIFSLSNRMNLTNMANDNDQGMNFDNEIKFETIYKFGIPLTIIVISLTTITSLISLEYFNDNSKLTVNDYVFGVVILMAIFTTLTFVLNKSLSKLVEIRTRDIEKQKDDLEFLVEQKTQELIKVERLSAIGELSGRLAHDLRNPLSVMKMSLELIKLHSPNAKLTDSIITKRLDLIEKGIERISHQVDDVLDYVRDSPLNLSLISLRTLINNSIHKIEIPSDVKILISDSDVNIRCDLVKIEAVFINLIVNSIHAIDNGGTIQIKIKSDENDAIIDFIDSGNGIPEELFGKIFEPLFTTKQKGTGLGLASCKNIIEQHGGKILVKNNPTTFTIRIPLQSTKIYVK